MNIVILMGRLTRDPEVRYAQGENPMAIARYTLAVDRKRIAGQEASADFIICAAFGAKGEFAEKYFHKGTKVVVRGHIQTGSYTDKNKSELCRVSKEKNRIGGAEMKYYIVAAVSFCIGHIIACLLDGLAEHGCKRQPIRLTPSIKKIAMKSILISAAWPAYLLYVFISCIELSRGEVGACSTSRKKKKKSIIKKWREYWKRKN